MMVWYRVPSTLHVYSASDSQWTREAVLCLAPEQVLETPDGGGHAAQLLEVVPAPTHTLESLEPRPHLRPAESGSLDRDFTSSQNVLSSKICS